MDEGSAFFMDHNISGYLNDNFCGDSEGGANTRSSSTSQDRLISSSDSSSSKEDASASSMNTKFTELSKQDVKDYHADSFVSGAIFDNLSISSAAHIRGNHGSHIPVNFLESLAAINKAQLPAPYSPPSLCSNPNFPNLSLFLQEPSMLEISRKAAESRGKSQKCEPVLSPQNPLFPISEMGKSQLQQGNEWLKISRNISNHSSKGFSDYWLSTTKTTPMKFTGRRIQNASQKTSLETGQGSGWGHLIQQKKLLLLMIQLPTC